MENKEQLRMELKEILKQVIANTGITVEEIEQGYLLDVPVEHDVMVAGKSTWKEKRRQFVYVTFGRKTLDGKDLFQIYTICGPEDSRYYRSALQLNMNLSAGAFGISQIEVVNRHLKRDLLTHPVGTVPKLPTEHRDYFVMVETFLMEEASPTRIKTSIKKMAQAGDRMEKLLIGKDIS